MSKVRLPTGSIIGTFGKGIDNAISINFSVSASDNCDDACPHKGTTCYAERIEKRPDRKQLVNKLKRHGEMPPAMVCGRAIVEINTLMAKGKVIPWVRISTAGSLPQPNVVRGNKLFASQFRALLKLCYDNGIPMHIPVETHAKAQFYRSLSGGLAVVRESVHSTKRFLTATGNVSTVAGDRSQSLLERIDSARLLAAQRSQAVRKTIVCPAVTAAFKMKLARSVADKAFRASVAGKNKCGNCTACSQGNIDVVYPLH